MDLWRLASTSAYFILLPRQFGSRSSYLGSAGLFPNRPIRQILIASVIGGMQQQRLCTRTSVTISMNCNFNDLVIYIMWNLWKERNRRILENILQSVQDGKDKRGSCAILQCLVTQPFSVSFLRRGIGVVPVSRRSSFLFATGVPRVAP